MAVHYYAQNRELEEISNNWKSYPKFAAFLSQFPDNEHYTSANLADDFFARVKERHKKHFDQWRLKYLHLALGRESLPAQYIARWLLGSELPTGTYVSAKHKTTIDIAAMRAFLTDGNTPQDHYMKAFY